MKSQIKKLPKRKRPIQKLKKQRYLQKKKDKERHEWKLGLGTDSTCTKMRKMDDESKQVSRMARANMRQVERRHNRSKTEMGSGQNSGRGC